MENCWIAKFQLFAYLFEVYWGKKCVCIFLFEVNFENSVHFIQFLFRDGCPWFSVCQSLLFFVFPRFLLHLKLIEIIEVFSSRAIKTLRNFQAVFSGLIICIIVIFLSSLVELKPIPSESLVTPLDSLLLFFDQSSSLSQLFFELYISLFLFILIREKEIFLFDISQDNFFVVSAVDDVWRGIEFLTAEVVSLDRMM